MRVGAVRPAGDDRGERHFGLRAVPQQLNHQFGSNFLFGCADLDGWNGRLEGSLGHLDCFAHGRNFDPHPCRPAGCRPAGWHPGIPSRRRWLSLCRIPGCAYAAARCRCVCPASPSDRPASRKTASHSAGSSPYGKALISKGQVPYFEHFQFGQHEHGSRIGREEGHRWAFHQVEVQAGQVDQAGAGVEGQGIQVGRFQQMRLVF